MQNSTVLTSVILASILSTSLFAEQYDVPGDFPTIQEALDAIPAPGGVEHVVSVAPGVYAGEILTSGKGFTLRCSSDEEHFTIAESPFLLAVEFVPAGKKVVIENAIFRDTVYGPDERERVPSPVLGGGLRALSVDVKLYNCRFERCGSMDEWGEYYDDYIGGGIYADGSSVLMRDCSMIDCGAASGGGLAASDGTVNVKDCLFEGNRAQSWYLDEGTGGHVDLHYVSDDSIFERCTFNYGHATMSSAAVHADGLGAIKFLECTFRGNRVETEEWDSIGSGACSVYSADLSDYNRQIRFDRCHFQSNSVHCDSAGFFVGFGGAIQAEGNTLIENCTFDRNSAGVGGTIHHDGGPLVIRRCTIDHGDATFGGGGFNLGGGALAHIFDVKVRNCRADDEGDACMSSGGITTSPERVAIMQRLLVSENYQQDQDAWGFIAGGILFGNTLEENGWRWQCEDDGIRHVSLTHSTICGNNVEGVPNNIHGSYVDPGNNRISDECIYPDLSRDGVVDGQDLAIVLGLWGEDCIGCQADLDDSGMIDGADLTEVLGAWGAGS